MRIIDGIKLQGRPAEIPDCGREELPQFFVEMGYKVGAEIGVFEGEFSEMICKAGLKFFAIDPWIDYDDYPRGKEAMNLYYEHAKRVLSSYENCVIIRKTSMDALNDIPDESLDFVYIDGNHLFQYVAQDICEWSKKVRKGGVVSGHDYLFTPTTTILNTCHVRWVLDAYIGAYKIKNYYILGRKNALDGEKRDRYRSWMFIKE